MGSVGLPGGVLAQDAQPSQPAVDQAPDHRDLFANFLHHAVLGKFNRADAYAKRLLDSEPDPAEILQFADQYSNSMKTLFLLISKIEVSDSARRIIDLIHEGELLMRKDPQRVKLNIQKLGGDSRLNQPVSLHTCYTGRSGQESLTFPATWYQNRPA